MGQRAVNETLAGGNVRRGHGAQPPAVDAGAEAEIDTRFHDIPAMDHQDKHVTMTVGQFLNPLGKHRENPGRFARDIFDPIAVQGVAVHPRVYQRVGLQAAGKFVRDIRRV